jgi:ABC-type phosphate transport system substrate-binding protein
MPLFSKLLAGAVSATVLAALVAGPALADPPTGTIPRASDAVGVGSDTTQYLLDQLALDFDTAHAGAKSKLYSWDAVNPDTLAIGDDIVTKKGCASISRPDGTNQGIRALEANARPAGKAASYCIDFARASRPRTSTDLACAPGGICFVTLAGDAVTWASRSAASGGTDAPANLTPAQLVKIYECEVTNWDQVGGQNAPIEAFLPQTGSGTRTFFLTALGGGTTPITPGSCVSDGATTGDPGGTIEENEGINPLLDSPEAIFIYSVGGYIAQAYRSAACVNAGCGPALSGPPCSPAGAENEFGCNVTGVLTINKINNTSPATPWPLPAPPAPPAINKNVKISKKFDPLFQRLLYDVVRYDPDTADHIPGPEAGAPGGVNLEQFFASRSAGTSDSGAPGFVCGSTGTRDIEDYGFVAEPACGMPS